jgi:hypothetical protein
MSDLDALRCDHYAARIGRLTSRHAVRSTFYCGCRLPEPIWLSAGQNLHELQHP